MGKKRSNEAVNKDVEKAPMPLDATSLPQTVGMVAQEMSRSSKTERRAKLIAAEVALVGIQFEIDGWPHLVEVRKEIAAAIGRMELRD